MRTLFIIMAAVRTIVAMMFAINRAVALRYAAVAPRMLAITSVGHAAVARATAITMSICAEGLRAALLVSFSGMPVTCTCA